MADIELIKELRELTGVSVAQIKKALEEADNVKEKALERLKELAGAMATKKADRELSAGVVGTYVHAERIGAMVVLACETDFVARNDAFQELARELAMHAAAMRPESPEEMLKQPFVKDENITVRERIEQAVAKLGENIQLSRFSILSV
jgi:elongation factor Ts